MTTRARRLPSWGFVLPCLVALALLSSPSAGGGGEPLPAPPLGHPPLGTEVMVPVLGDAPPAPSAETVGGSSEGMTTTGPAAPPPEVRRRGAGEAPMATPPGRLDEDPGPPVPSTAQAPAEPIAPPPVTELDVMLDWYPSPQHAALIVARDKGMFARRGLEVRLSTPADPNVPTRLLAASRVDLALTRQPLLHLKVDQGLPLIRVATLVDGSLAALVVRDGLGIDSPADLAGRRIGHADEDSREILLAMLLRPHGVKRAEVEMRDVNFGLARAMSEDRVDGVIGAMRHLLPRQLGDEGVATRLMRVEEHGVPLHDGLILLANRDRLNGQREAIRHLVEALEEATAWILEHPAEAWARLLATEPGLETPANLAAWPDILLHLSASPAAVDHGRYARFEKFLHEAGLVEHLTPVERLVLDPGTF
ncbi:ABC transporter substrate-binding protein [Halomonas sp. LBP4]|uniref:ABC transporter substrate-binding protein n=1 Tax=Halomonas sp. LBP4 TaxID=2044917 RepID=UPI000D7579A5|nr:ABC transporter substrate-binding protein [Halomonas sp. LBP4]PXX95317.1 ABC transporter substrate-binding protein [Halomonas sp. LBP4]